MAKGVVDFKDLCAINALWVLIRGIAALREIASSEIIGNLASVELVLQRNLYGITGKGNRTKSGNFRTDTCDTSDEEIGSRQIEEWRKGKGGYGGCSVNFCILSLDVKVLLCIGI